MKRVAMAATAIVGFATGAQAADVIKLGFMASMSGVTASAGLEQQKGLELALSDLGGKLGGVPVKLFTEDDRGDPSTAVQLASKFADQDQVDILTGITGSNTEIPVVPPLVEAGIFVVGAVAGPEDFAGKDCKPNLFSSDQENEDWGDALAAHLSDQGIKSIYFMGADYQAGWQKIGGAMRHYKGKAFGPVYTPFQSQIDLAPELSQVRDANPDAVFVFYPGGAGITFLKQFAQAGLHDKIKIFSEGDLSDESVFAGQGDAALGIIQSTNWSYELDNPANKKFVTEYMAKYKVRPSIFAALQYDAVNLIDSAAAAVHGNVADKDAFRAALKKADFQSVRGPFKFDNNHYPVQTIYLTEVVKDPDGQMRLALRGEAARDWHDDYHDKCPMK
jgi:branched-chain amino acid transport system substrate-binding protein